MQTLMLTMGEDLQFILYFAFLSVFLVAERLFPKRRPLRPQGDRWRTNIRLTVLVILSLPLIPVSFVTVAQWTEDAEIGLLNTIGSEWPMPVLVVITLWLRGSISFTTHYLNHKVPILWRFHRVHHFDTELDVSSTVRFHPVEMPLSLLIGLPMVVALGLSPWMLILYELFDVAITLFSHSNLRLTPSVNRFLRYIIVTPDLHKVHHSSFQPETDSNFSAVFPVWDILFGTYRTATREPLETMPLGLDSVPDPQANQFWWLLASPFLSDRELKAALETGP